MENAKAVTTPVNADKETRLYVLKTVAGLAGMFLEPVIFQGS